MARPWDDNYFGEGDIPDIVPVGPAIDYDLEEEEETAINVDNDMLDALGYLHKTSLTEGISLFDHLNELLKKILAERPENILEFFEEYSRNMKANRFRPSTDRLQDQFVPPDHYERAKRQIILFQPSAVPDFSLEEEIDEGEEGGAVQIPRILESLYYFEQIGVGLPRDEMVCITMALQQLKQSEPLTKYRFWGKITGTERDYIVAETELTPEEYERRNMEVEAGEEMMAGEEGDKTVVEEAEIEDRPEIEIMGEFGEKEEEEKWRHPPEFPPLPKNPYVKPPPVPTEKSGEGVNKKVYFVCNSPGDLWIMLPDVTPEQITIARKIRRYFTGNLDSEVISYPPFPGTEKDYLRAQIARISAGTQISPLGFYSFTSGDEEEEEEPEEEEEGGRTEYFENHSFEPLPLKDLVDDSMSFWVHHAQHILKQGRTKWWNPSGKEGGEEEAEEEEEEEEGGGAMPEVGPALLSPLSEDTTLEMVSPWRTHISSNVLPQLALAAVHSNLWPGAHAYAFSKNFDNVYIGDGQKHLSYNYNPPPLEIIQTEYPLGPEIMEISDPTVEEEEAWRLAHEKKPMLPLLGEGEGEGEGEEVEEEEEEDE